MFAHPLLLLPDFAVILLGTLLARRLHFGAQFWSGAERLVYFVLLPPMLFTAISSAKFDMHDAAPFVLLGVALIGLGVLASWLAKPLIKPPAAVLASCMQTGFRFNSYVGLALASSLWGGKGVALLALLIAVCLPLANVAAVIPLARHQKLHVGRELLRNPLVMATLAGLVANLMDFTPPQVASVFLQRLGNASLALGLLCIGSGLKFPSHSATTRALAYYTALKLIGMPLIAAGLIALASPPPLEAAVLLLFAALPTASSAYILATRMGGDGATVATIVSAQTLFSMLTLPVVMALAPS